MEPSPFAKLLQLADVRQGDVVLVIGAGTGYSAAVIARLAGSVVALECNAELAEQARLALSELGTAEVSLVGGRLQDGWAQRAPFDVIFIEGAVDAVPEVLFDQLRGGRSSRRRRGPRQCRCRPALPQGQRFRNGASRIQCGGQAAAGLRTGRGFRVLGALRRMTSATILREMTIGLLGEMNRAQGDARTGARVVRGTCRLGGRAGSSEANERVRRVPFP
nr:protein-L-isoaspartate(D-aspartate) O-methyltransferase (PCMT) [uncultured bacterium]